ncbi:MAG: hypothetical protein RSF90_00530 [Pygmaiobacter sp.]
MNTKRTLCAVFALALTLALFSGCAAKAPSTGVPSAAASSAARQGTGFTDALGRSVTIESTDKVVSLYGSFAECWMLAGGTLAGTTQDAIKERGLALGEDVSIVGTVQEPNLEAVIALAPDFVLLSADIAPQVALDGALSEAGIPHAYFRVDHYTDYLAMLRGATICMRATAVPSSGRLRRCSRTPRPKPHTRVSCCCALQPAVLRPKRTTTSQD